MHTNPHPINNIVVVQCKWRARSVIDERGNRKEEFSHPRARFNKL